MLFRNFYIGETVPNDEVLQEDYEELTDAEIVGTLLKGPVYPLFYPQLLPNILHYITPVSITPVTLSLVISLTSSCLACM